MEVGGYFYCHVCRTAYISLFFFSPLLSFPVDWWCPWAPTWASHCRSFGQCLSFSLSLSHACPCCYIAADHWSIVPYTTSSSSSVFIDLHCNRVPLLFPAQKKKRKVSPMRAHFTYICVNKLKQIIIPLLPPKNMQRTRASVPHQMIWSLGLLM